MAENQAQQGQGAPMTEAPRGQQKTTLTESETAELRRNLRGTDAKLINGSWCVLLGLRNGFPVSGIADATGFPVQTIDGAISAYRQSGLSGLRSYNGPWE